MSRHRLAPPPPSRCSARARRSATRSASPVRLARLGRRPAPSLCPLPPPSGVAWGRGRPALASRGRSISTSEYGRMPKRSHMEIGPTPGWWPRYSKSYPPPRPAPRTGDVEERRRADGRGGGDGIAISEGWAKRGHLSLKSRAEGTICHRRSVTNVRHISSESTSCDPCEM